MEDTPLEDILLEDTLLLMPQQLATLEGKLSHTVPPMALLESLEDLESADTLLEQLAILDKPSPMEPAVDLELEDTPPELPELPQAKLLPMALLEETAPLMEPQAQQGKLLPTLPAAVLELIDKHSNDVYIFYLATILYFPLPYYKLNLSLNSISSNYYKLLAFYYYHIFYIYYM
jgi:hypothetical protein